MLPFLAAAGHNNYANSLHLYLQNMQETHPEVYMHFVESYHVIRKSDRYWAGLLADMTIEQVLMRSLKTTCDLTRGSGMTESQRLVWLLSTPAGAHVNCAMQELTEVSYTTSHQHNDVSKARQERYMTDTLEIIEYLTPRSPFGVNSTLHSIALRITADATLNCDCTTGWQEGTGMNGREKHGTAQDTFKKETKYALSVTAVPSMLETTSFILIPNFSSRHL